MKITIDEKIKNRIIGLVVVITILFIAIPMIFKNSSRPIDFDSHSQASLKIPPKPTINAVAVPEKNVVFEKVKEIDVDVPEVAFNENDPAVAQAKEAEVEFSELDQISQNENNNLPEIEDKLQQTQENLTQTKKQLAEIKTGPEEIPNKKSMPQAGIQIHEESKHKLIVTTKKSDHKSKITQTHRGTKLVSRPVVIKTINNNLIVKKGPAVNNYGIQLASFAKLKNAQKVIRNLKSKGIQANLEKVNTTKGLLYQVKVGWVPKKMDALDLQHRLASETHLQGIIISKVS